MNDKLFEALSACLPYGVICNVKDDNINKDYILTGITVGGCNFNGSDTFYGFLSFEIKPYLFPIESITEEQKKSLRIYQEMDERIFTNAISRSQHSDNSMRGRCIPHYAAEWAYRNHIDIWGLIPDGLAIEATKETYK